MSRSKWKGNFLNKAIEKLAQKKRLNSKKKIKIWSRNSVIPSFLIGKIVFIHNGKEFKKITITREKIGFKFGEFSSTRFFKAKKTDNKTKKTA